MNKYGLHGKLVAQEGHAEQLQDILLEASKLMEGAKGCRLYTINIDEKEPNAVWITEIWDSSEDHEASLSVPGVRELIGKAIPILAEQPQKGQELTVLGGFGV